MGLDNGIILKVIDKNNTPSFVKEHDEVLYWRKCWGLREAFLQVLDPAGIKRRENEFYFDIEAEDIPALIRALKPFFSKDYWNENAESIWEYDEMFETLINNVINLEKLKDFLTNHSDEIERCYFYDSY